MLLHQYFNSKRLLASMLNREMFITDNSSDGQFIFKENEFEDDNFMAANFVAKYRRVSSLESLKDQLLQYSNALKQQLYNIINRDYKDFITISTKVWDVHKSLINHISFSNYPSPYAIGTTIAGWCGYSNEPFAETTC